MKSTIQFILLFYFSLINSISAQTFYVNVPFQNFFINPGDIIQATYDFNSLQRQNMVCFAVNTLPVGNIQWRYQGVPFSSKLSVVLKQANSSYSGLPADTPGTVIIQNTENTILEIGCLPGL